MDEYQLENKKFPCWDDVTRKEYFVWLCSIVDVYKDEPNGYWNLMNILFEKEFTWLVPNDDNRIKDGLSMRCKFAECYYDIYEFGLSYMEPCSVLEVLVALAIRMDDMTIKPGEEKEIDNKFFEMIDNLGLTMFNNSNLFEEDLIVIDDILETFINRQYGTDGNGGLFPLVRTEQDQRTVEIWYQMNAYLMENFFLDE